MRAFILSCILFFAVSFVQAQTAEDLFQQAVRLERTDGDLDGAIQLYRKIADDFPSSREMAARALYQLGTLYELQGKELARDSYEELLAEYSDQKELASKTRERLAALKTDHPAASVSDEGMKILSLSFVEEAGTTLHPRIITPDGKKMLVTITYSDSTRWLALAPLENEIVSGSAAKRLIERDNNFTPWPVAFSPDSKKLVGAFYEEDAALIRIIDTVTGDTKVIWEEQQKRARRDSSGTYTWASGLAWSLDGSQIIASGTVSSWEPGVDYETQGYVRLFDLNSEQVREHQYPDAIEAYDLCQIDTESVYAGYFYTGEGQDNYYRLERVDLATGERSKLTPDLENHILIGCLPSVKSVVTLNNQFGSNNLSAYQIDTRGNGDFRHIRTLPTGAASYQMSRDGSFIFSIGQSGAGGVYIFDLDSEYNPLEKSLTRQPTLGGRPSVLMGWSQDGKRIAYGIGSGIAEVADLDTGSIRRLEGGHYCCGTSRWSAFEDHIVTVKSPHTTYIYDVNLETAVDSVEHHGLGLTGDGKYLLYDDYTNMDTDRCIWSFELKTRKSEVFFCPENMGSALLNVRSRSEDVVISVWRKSYMDEEGNRHRPIDMYVGNTTSRQFRLVRQFDDDNHLGPTSLTWAPDGKSIMYSTSTRPDFKSVSERLWLQGGRVEPYDFPGLKLTSNRPFVLSPDGKKVAVIARPDAALEYWIVEGIQDVLKK